MKKLLILILALSFVSAPVEASTAKKESKKVVVAKIDPIVALRQDYEARIKRLEDMVTLLSQPKTEVNPSITAEDIAPFLENVAYVTCSNATERWSGSGTFIKYTDGWALLSNGHVLNGGDCLAGRRNAYDIADKVFSLSKNTLRWNVFTDIATSTLSGDSTDSLSLAATNVRYCDYYEPLGTPVVVIGYPASGVDGIGRRIVTTGVVSGVNYTSSQNLPYFNYFISAKMDSGNSGGLVLAKDKLGMCMLGVPTWLKLGNYDTLGIVQNIHNVINH